MGSVRGFACAFFFLAVAFASPGWGAASGPDARAVARDVAHELGVQDRLPSEDARPVDERVDSGRPRPVAAAPSVPGAGGTGQVLLWVAGVLTAIFIVMTLVESAFGRALVRGSGASPERAGELAAAAGPRLSLMTADELAADGRYTEAMHQLLHDTVGALRRQLGANIPDALTSREILRALPLKAAEHNAFRDMIERVEQTWFAQRRAALDDYHAVRACFAVVAAGTVAR
jgi:hypothetical protein